MDFGGNIEELHCGDGFLRPEVNVGQHVAIPSDQDVVIAHGDIQGDEVMGVARESEFNLFVKVAYEGNDVIIANQNDKSVIFF